MTMRHADAMWRTALGQHANRLRSLRNRVNEALSDITVKKYTITVDVIREDLDHVGTVIGELEEAGWKVKRGNSQLEISVPESIRNPPQSA